MARAGKETTLKDCDANIAIYYRMVKKDSRRPAHHEQMMNKSLDRRLTLMTANVK